MNATWFKCAGTWVVVLLLANGCSEEPSSGAELGTEGGQLAGPSGAQLDVPPGALAATTTLTIEVVTTGYPLMGTDVSASGSVFAFTPHGQAFSLPATVTVPFTGSSSASLQLLTAQPNGQWETVGGAEVAGNAMKADVTHFSFFAVTRHDGGLLNGTWRITSKTCNGAPVDMTGWAVTDFVITNLTGSIQNEHCDIPVTLSYPSAGSVAWVIGENTCGGVGDTHTATHAIVGDTLTLTEELTPAGEYGCPSDHQVTTLTRQ